MANSILVELGVESPGDCLVARSSDEVQATISDVARSTSTDADGELVEEFTLANAEPIDHPAVETVFDADSHTVYQFRHSDDADCICRKIESFGCPISNLHARDGALYVSFYAPDIDTVRDIVTHLRETFGSIHVHQLARDDDRADPDFVVVDRSQLTERQRDVLETAHGMGYFEHPKQANAGDVADELGIAISTFSEHLAAAQRKLLDELLRS